MILILEIIITLLAVCGLALLVNHIEDSHKKTNLLSFAVTRASELPVVKLYNNDKEFLFLIDTGSNYCVINKESLPLLDHSIIEGATGEAYGMEGNIIQLSYAYIPLHSVDGILFEGNFQVIDMSEAFGQLKENNGVEVVGILGSKFLRRYSFTVDFKNLIAYTK